MTKLFFDTEFTGLHQKTTLISIGIVSECGKTFYAEFTDYDKSQVDDWLRNNVIKNLFLNNTDNGATMRDWMIKSDSPEIRIALQDWLKQFDQVQVWSDCLSYDWVLFCELFGHAFKIPKNVYYIPFDICPLLLEYTGNADISREEYAGNMIEVNDSHNWGVKKHNALWDAYVIKACFKKLVSDGARIS